ncbi:unnamed protein product [Somion occarium]
MSNHPDTLVSYVKYWGKINDNVTSARMIAIDTKGMTLTYTTKAGGDAKKQVTVPFDPPLAGYAEVKPRLMNMKVDAEEALGMTRAPQLSTFRLTPRVLQTVVVISILVYTTFAPSRDSPSYHPIFLPANLIRSSIPSYVITGSWIFMMVVHFLEGLYTLSLCKKHRTGFVVGLQYFIVTFLFGYPVFTDIHKQVQTMRIDSIMKGQ